MATSTANKQWAFDAGVRAVRDHCERVGIDATVERSAVDGVYRVRRQSPVPAPLVSVVIPTRGSAGAVWGVDRVHVVEAVRSMVERSTYERVEYVVVADTVTPDAVLDELRAIAGGALRIVPFDEPFNFSAKINRGVVGRRRRAAAVPQRRHRADRTGQRRGDGRRSRSNPGVGLVGAKLLFADGTLQHAGHVYPGLVTHALLGFDGDHPGPNHMALLVRECSGVTAAAAMITRERFDRRRRVRRGVPVELQRRRPVAPAARATGSATSGRRTQSGTTSRAPPGCRPPPMPSATGCSRGGAHEIANDPYFNPNLEPGRSDWLERPGRSGAPPYSRDRRGRLRFS